MWFNWQLVGLFVSYQDAEKRIVSLLELSPVKLDDLVHYLKLR